jgi:hypothetical protein
LRAHRARSSRGRRQVRNLLDGPILVRGPEDETLPCPVKRRRTALDVVGRDLVHKLGVPNRSRTAWTDRQTAKKALDAVIVERVRLLLIVRPLHEVFGRRRQ